MMNTKKFNEAVMECYRRMYAASTPPADLDELVKVSPKNSDGETVIPYDKHEISQSAAAEILEQVKKEYKIPKTMLGYFSWAVYLGASPKFSKE